MATCIETGCTEPAIAGQGGAASRETKTFRLLNDYQRGFPLVPEPFSVIAAECGLTAEAVLAALREWSGSGVVSRVGAVLAPRRIGASALATVAAPAAELEAIAARISAVPEVNHNYQREHAFNLWFVITAASPLRLQQVVEGIEQDTGRNVIVLPLEEEFHIDLGFDLASGARDARRGGLPASYAVGDAACSLPGVERRLMTALQAGLPLQPRPFEALGRSVDLSEAMVIELISRWLDDGLIKRFGVVVRHHELGFRANAMCVWDVPDDRVGALGRLLAAEPAVTLCYRRGRRLPDWPYNLFCMIHGKSRDTVLALRDDLASRLGIDAWPHSVLFSCRRFKQQGARYLAEAEA